MQLPNSAQELQLLACFTITLRPSYLHVAAFLERRVATTVAFAQGALAVAAEAALVLAVTPASCDAVVVLFEYLLAMLVRGTRFQLSLDAQVRWINEVRVGFDVGGSVVGLNIPLDDGTGMVSTILEQACHYFLTPQEQLAHARIDLASVHVVTECIIICTVAFLLP